MRSLKPCVDPGSVAGLGTGEFSIPGSKWKPTEETQKGWCNGDGFSSTGGENEAWMTSGRSNVSFGSWERDDCRYGPVSNEELPSFVNRLNIFFWGDSVHHRVFSALQTHKSGGAGKLELLSKDVNGAGLRELFETPTKPGKYWAKFKSRLLQADLIFLNSGFHDLSPEWFEYKI